MKTAPLLSRIDRRKIGKTLREKCPRSSLDEWKPRSHSQDPLKLLEQTDADRIPGLIPLRYERMSESPIKFFRGSAIIQARDFAKSASGLIVQTCGDFHLMNFGDFANPERALIFDVNDFDETCPGPWEWDIKRHKSHREEYKKSLAGERQELFEHYKWQDTAIKVVGWEALAHTAYISLNLADDDGRASGLDFLI